ncbi:GGDEF domain-containing protein [Solirubrobacter ginsenosidimutans]|uniref:GGDEF domain-containing protein n=1 Tax=Solirubrobacter ginsenosidimutans TaxID=490573 RepID=A0A9X3S1G9_9ACTN|nr:GGDEF domain-containing protein [Solirubrobacter ginsenosidimutans]MDA0160186.1 GGDEF domain-containing protein [Solirubrobacter ginsenosidimutans]
MPPTEPLPQLAGASVVGKSGAVIYAGAAAVGAIESVVAGEPTSSPLPIAIAFLVAALLWRYGGRVDRRLLFGLGPIGAVLLGCAIATSPPGDGAVMYAWSVLWVASFFGTAEAVAIVLTVGAVQGAVVVHMPGGTFDQWFDVTASMAVVAAVVRSLAARNEKLVGRLTVESRIDPLTGVLNRRGLEERFDVELARAARERRPLAVVAIDIDHFKRINDEHGHQAGDRALVWLAATLCEHTRGADVIARVGGEEFTIVLPGADLASAYDFADRLRERVAHVDVAIPLTISAGVAAADAPTTADALTEAADRALYDAKRGGRNRVASTV